MNKQLPSAHSASQESHLRDPRTSLIGKAVVGSFSADLKATSTLNLTYVAPSSFVSLMDIRARLKRSNSWLYANNIVPIYDDEGQQINDGKAPSRPWEQLPKPRIKTGKKLWLAADIEAWFCRLNVHKNQPAETFITSLEASQGDTP